MMPLDTYLAIKLMDLVVGLSFAALLIGGFFAKSIYDDWRERRDK